MLLFPSANSRMPLLMRHLVIETRYSLLQEKVDPASGRSTDRYVVLGIAVYG
jgi:hypothetical protein